MAATTSLTELDVDEVVALLAQWRLGEYMGDQIRGDKMDGDCLMCIEKGDLDPADFPSMKTFHWKKFWLKLKDAQANGVTITTPPNTAPAAAAASAEGALRAAAGDVHVAANNLVSGSVGALAKR